MTPEELPPQVLEALRAGDRVEAVKQVRMARGCSVPEANALIAAYERAGTAGLPPATRAERAIKQALPPKAIEALQQGRLIEAIRIVRASGMGLAEAKALVEKLRQEMPRAPAEKHRHDMPRMPAHAVARAKGLSPGEVPRVGGGGGKWVVLAVIAGAVIGFALLR